VFTRSKYLLAISLLCALAASVVKSAASEDPGSAARSLWTAHVEQILTDHCTKCHAGVKQKAGIDLRTPQTILKGGDEGPIVIPGNAKNSKLFKALQLTSDPHMPPMESKQLDEEQIAIIARWIEKLPSTNQASGPVDWSASIYATTKPLNMPAWAGKLDTTRAIDRFIEQGWNERKVKHAPATSDAAFVRRLYLDLIGRIPTESELAQFESLPAKTRRAQLIDQLLASKEYAAYMSEIFDVVLMGRKSDVGKAHKAQRKPDEKWMQFLETAFERNRPWNEIVRQIIVARPQSPEDKGAEWFLYERKDNYQAIAEAIAPIAFGVNVKCAQCHGHPLAPEIEQRHYWGIVAAFNRSKNVDANSGRGVSESAIGGFVNFADLRKRTIPAALIFPNGKSVPETRPADGAKEEDKPDNYLVPPPKEKEKAEKPSIPKFSRREELAKAVAENNPMLAKAFVNRVWAMLLGRGLVHPVDTLDSRHPASHPELLEYLATDFANHSYDIKRLIRSIALTRVYQLDSKGGTATAPPESFARALDKPLPAEALYRSLIVAITGQTNSATAAELRDEFVERFPDVFPAEYNATLHQAMFLSNNAKLADLLRPSNDNTTAAALAQKTPEAETRLIFHRLLQRAPDREEVAQSSAFLKSGPADKTVPELLWTVLACAEFQCNH
jgi:mono/diheme cytochrome c family protein